MDPDCGSGSWFGEGCYGSGSNGGGTDPISIYTPPTTVYGDAPPLIDTFPVFFQQGGGTTFYAQATASGGGGGGATFSVTKTAVSDIPTSTAQETQSPDSLPNQESGVPPPINVVSVYRQQIPSYLKAIALNILCPHSGSGAMVLKSLRNGIIRRATTGAIKGGLQGAAGGTVFDGVGAAPGAALGAAAGAVNSLLTATVRAKACDALGVQGY
jgi:hypothetical protein